MNYSNVKYLLIPVLIVLFITQSCSTNFRGLFEKRKHLKGWHFHKRISISPKSLNAPNEVDFKKQNENEKVGSAKKSIADIDHLKILKHDDLNTGSVVHEIIDPRFSLNGQKRTLQENVDKQRRKHTQGKVKKASYKSTKNKKKPVKSWTLNSAFFFLLMMFPFLFKNGKRKQVQAWAARNKRKTRSLLVVLKVFLATTSITMGFVVGAPFSLPLLLLTVGLLILSIVCYEYWNRSGKMSQKKNSRIFGVMNTSTSFGFFSLGGMLKSDFDFSQWSMNRGLMNAFGNNPDELVHHPIYIITGMFLLILFTGILIVLIGWLSCYLYCGSSELAGVLIFIVGGSAVIFFSLLLTFKLFERKEITEQKKKKRLWWSALIALLSVAIFSLLLFLG